MQSQELNTTIEQLISPVTVSFEFIPYPYIEGTDREWKHDGKPTKALHYDVIFRNGDRELWRTNYSMGVGHIPGYSETEYPSERAHMEQVAISSGRIASARDKFWRGKKILPKLADVIYCLVSDADVLNYSNFEDWANEFGYDPDSRSAEKTYKQCLDSALSLRTLLGEDKLSELRELLADY